MKNKLKGLVCLFLLTLSLQSVGQVAVVDYMKVPPGGGSKYLEVEKAWKKLHQARLDAGLILGWSLYEVMFSGAEDAYQYATVTMYKSLDDYEKSFDQSVVSKAYPDYKEKDWDNFGEKTGASRTLTNTKLFYYVVGIDPKDITQEKYLMISTMRVKPTGMEAYEKMEKDWYKPLHTQMIKQGAMEGWSIWGKWLGDATEYQYVAVNSYSSFDQMTRGNYTEAIKKALPGKNPAEITAKTYAARDMTGSQIWKKIDEVRK
jgi:hypothetical protein